MGSVESMRAVARNRALVRAQLAMLCAGIGDAGFFTAVTVWAYQARGAGTVGAYTAVTFAASAVLAPLLAAIADRLPRRTVLVTMDLLRLAFVVGAAASIALASPLLTLVLAGAPVLLAAPARSAHRAWLPSLADSPAELTAANATASTLDSIAVLAGPAVAALLLAVGDATTTFAAFVVGYAASLLLVLGTRAVTIPRAPAVPGVDAASLLEELGAGFALVLGDRGLRAVAAQVCAQTFVGGANRVLLVVLAAEVLHAASSGLGLLTAVMGACALAGGLIAMARVSRGRVGRDLCVGVAGWGVALLPVAIVPIPAFVVVAAVVCGLANPVVDVNLDTALQRLAPEHVLARVFGAVDALYVVAAALGALVTPLLLAHTGLRVSLLVVAAPALVAAALSWSRMVDLDARLGEPGGASLLRGIPWFARLAPATLEELARALEPETVPAGSVLIAEGDPGTDFFVIEEGRVEVTQGGTWLRVQGPGEYFGEIALLHDVPRTATVVALDTVVVHRLGRDAFLRALGEGGRAEAHRAAAIRWGVHA